MSLLLGVTTIHARVDYALLVFGCFAGSSGSSLGTGDDRAMIFGALLWMADKLKSDQGGTCSQAMGRKGEAGVSK